MREDMSVRREVNVHRTLSKIVLAGAVIGAGATGAIAALVTTGTPAASGSAPAASVTAANPVAQTSAPTIAGASAPVTMVPMAARAYPAAAPTPTSTATCPHMGSGTHPHAGRAPARPSPGA